MKKSKIIVPALGLLLLSTAASVSGTVAWFTANRTYNTFVDKFTVGSVDGNLSAVCVAGIGTKAGTKTNTNDMIQFWNAGSSDKAILTDASYDHVNDVLYTDNAAVSEAASGVNKTSFVAVGTDGSRTSANYKVSSTATNAYYYAVTWDVQITYTFGGDDHDVHIFFDEVNSTMADGDKLTDNSGTASVSKGMRFAMLAPAASPTAKKVWAPMETEAKCEGYAGGASTYSTYSDSVLIANDYATNNSTLTSGLAVDGLATSTADDRADYLGTVLYKNKNASDQVTLTVTIVAWLEGSDENVLSTNDIYEIEGSMKFYARTGAAVTA